MYSMTEKIDQLAITTIRTLSIDAIEKANSGHPGLPMGAAPMAYTLWTQHIHHNPSNPNGSIVTVLYFQQDTAPCYYIACFT